MELMRRTLFYYKVGDEEKEKGCGRRWEIFGTDLEGEALARCCALVGLFRGVIR